MKHISNYPLVLTLSMFFGPLLMVGASFWESALFRWTSPIVGALMVMFAFFFVAKRLHEQIEEVATLKEQLNGLRDRP